MIEETTPERAGPTISPNPICGSCGGRGEAQYGVPSPLPCPNCYPKNPELTAPTFLPWRLEDYQRDNSLAICDISAILAHMALLEKVREAAEEASRDIWNSTKTGLTHTARNLQCPFCGSHSLIRLHNDDNPGIVCRDCRATAPTTEAWNNRNPDNSALTARLALLEKVREAAGKVLEVLSAEVDGGEFMCAKSALVYALAACREVKP